MNNPKEFKRFNRSVIGRGSSLISDTMLYRPTALFDDDGGVALFVYRDIAYTRGSGQRVDKTVETVLGFDSIAEVKEFLYENDIREGVDK